MTTQTEPKTGAARWIGETAFYDGKVYWVLVIPELPKGIDRPVAHCWVKDINEEVQARLLK